ncbi:MAG: ATP-dependent zinc metalloprotease FtsH [Victivallaceae bacterium]
MMQDKKFKTDPKKNFPFTFFFLLFGVVLGIVVIQNFIHDKRAKIGFSHQLEHLVNLKLVIPEESRKVSLNDNLVTFSGRFKDKESQESLARYRYLELLSERHDLQSERSDLEKQLKELKGSVTESVVWFSSISGHPIPDSGYAVVDQADLGTGEYGLLIVKEKVESQPINLKSLSFEYEQLFESGIKGTIPKKREFLSNLSVLISKYRSPVLGIGSETVKNELRLLSQQMEEVSGLDVSDRKVQTIVGEVINRLSVISESLEESGIGGRFNILRSVRRYKEELLKFNEVAETLAKNELSLDKSRADVNQAVWYFNNQEMSSKGLEKQDPEVFNHWFTGAKDEWYNFEHNRSLSFKAPDQPRNLVLEKTFKSHEPPPHYANYIFTVLPIALVVLFLYFIFSRQMKGMGGSAMNFGKSPAKLLQMGQNKVTFQDVAGIEEAKEELVEIVDFLKNPTKFTVLGGRIPKGVLLIGPPGTGKTLIAKAVSGEADRPFFSIAGSSFVEMFVGVGASRIRDMFEQAKKNAPCIIFIDEIDAVGRHRGAGIGGGHDEREQTLNQLLVEMDGFDTNEGVILMAATNRPDVLDKALLRPGRFDRRVVIGLPDIKGRFEILKVHATKIKLDPTVDLYAIARSTPGASGADLENLLNEAALLAARKDRSAVTAAEVAESRDKVLYGKERRSLEMDEKEKSTTAYHESGHAIVGLVVEYADPVDKVTIIPRGLSLGATHFLPEKNKLSYWKKELFDQLAVLMGGRAAEEVFLGDISSGAQQDIVQATRLVRSMVCEWGMSESLGTVAYDESTESVYGSSSEKNYSQETAKIIDAEVKRILDNAYGKALDIVKNHKDKLELMTKLLLEFETLNATDVKEIMNNSWDSEKKKARMKEENMLFKKTEDLPPPPPNEIVSGDFGLKVT